MPVSRAASGPGTERPAGPVCGARLGFREIEDGGIGAAASRHQHQPRTGGLDAREIEEVVGFPVVAVLGIVALDTAELARGDNGDTLSQPLQQRGPPGDEPLDRYRSGRGAGLCPGGGAPLRAPVPRRAPAASPNHPIERDRPVHLVAEMPPFLLIVLEALRLHGPHQRSRDAARTSPRRSPCGPPARRYRTASPSGPPLRLTRSTSVRSTATPEIVAASARDVPAVHQLAPAGPLGPVHHGERGAHRPVAVEHPEAEALRAKPRLHPAQGGGHLAPEQGLRRLVARQRGAGEVVAVWRSAPLPGSCCPPPARPPAGFRLGHPAPLRRAGPRPRARPPRYRHRRPPPAQCAKRLERMKFWLRDLPPGGSGGIFSHRRSSRAWRLPSPGASTLSGSI